MIKFSNGYNIEYFASSGALSYNGKGYWWEQPLRWFNLFDTSLFTPITKTLTRFPNKGNCRLGFNCIRFVGNGVLNSFGLGNPGIDWWINYHKDFCGIVSIYPENEYSLIDILKKLNETNVIGIELNVSCPNTTDDLCTNERKIEYFLNVIKSHTELPIIVKLGIEQDIRYLFPRIDNYIEAISINSVAWRRVYPSFKSPLKKFGGGALSGKIIQPLVWNFINELKEVTDIPIIGSSIWDYEDIMILYDDLKVSAISFGSIFLRYPWRPAEYVRRFEYDSNRKNENKR